MLRYYIQPKRKVRPSKKTVRFETQPGYQLQHDWGEIEVEVAGQRCNVNFAVKNAKPEYWPKTQRQSVTMKWRKADNRSDQIADIKMAKNGHKSWR